MRTTRAACCPHIVAAPRVALRRRGSKPARPRLPRVIYCRRRPGHRMCANGAPAFAGRAAPPPPPRAISRRAPGQAGGAPPGHCNSRARRAHPRTRLMRACAGPHGRTRRPPRTARSAVSFRGRGSAPDMWAGQARRSTFRSQQGGAAIGRLASRPAGGAKPQFSVNGNNRSDTMARGKGNFRVQDGRPRRDLGGRALLIPHRGPGKSVKGLGCALWPASCEQAEKVTLRARRDWVSGPVGVVPAARPPQQRLRAGFKAFRRVSGWRWRAPDLARAETRSIRPPIGFPCWRQTGLARRSRADKCAMAGMFPGRLDADCRRRRVRHLAAGLSGRYGVACGCGGKPARRARQHPFCAPTLACGQLTACCC